ncbi:PDZ domain-containing protein [Rheinheimera metallidurans]|uniref:M61 family metallopeptidase n=1 Tax=Rheinheimera metallidurans TaxID=2925781 RepID=UPI003002A8B2
MNSIYYHVDITDVTAHLISVTLRFVPTQAIHELSLPAWIPGSYMIRDFARNIISIEATDNLGNLALTQLDKQTWQLHCNTDEVSVSYHVYAYDLSVRAAYVDDEVAVLNPACLCLGISQLHDLPHQIKIVKPTSALAQHWRVATGLRRNKNTDFLDFGYYNANNYAALIDSPILLGQFELREFTINDIPHYLVVTGDNLTDLTRFTDDLTKICQQQVKVFGALPDDLTSYWFLLWVTEEGYGGLEHLNSTLLLCSRFDLPAPNISTIDDNYQNLLALCSHEYFHTWWVKRLKPTNFSRYQLASEQYTTQLWLYEGFTSYFDDLALVQSGIISQTAYIKTLEKTISRVTRNPSDKVQSLVDSSFSAWTKFYKQDENAVNAVVSYYAKGALLAFCLDAALREQGSSLQQIVQKLWQEYLTSGTPDNALSVILTQLGFAELAQLSQRWLIDSAALPLTDAAVKLGLNLIFRPMQHADDMGGELNEQSQIFIGALTKVNNGLLQLTHVYHAGAAYSAGLMVGDQLLALEQRKITANNFSQLLQRYATNSSVTVHFYRKDRLLHCTLTLAASVQQVAMLSITEQGLCDSWLNAN